MLSSGRLHILIPRELIVAVRVLDLFPIRRYPQNSVPFATDPEPSIAVFVYLALARLAAVIVEFVHPHAVVDAALLDAALEVDASEGLAGEGGKEEAGEVLHVGG